MMNGSISQWNPFESKMHDVLGANDNNSEWKKRRKENISRDATVDVQKFEEHRINNSVGLKFKKKRSRWGDTRRRTIIIEMSASHLSSLSFSMPTDDIDRACLHIEWHNVDNSFFFFAVVVALIEQKLVAVFNVSIYFQLLHTSDTFKCQANNVSDWHSKCLCGLWVPASRATRSFSLTLSFSFPPCVVRRFEKSLTKIRIQCTQKKPFAYRTNSYFYLYENVLLLHVTSCWLCHCLPVLLLLLLLLERVPLHRQISSSILYFAS